MRILFITRKYPPSVGGMQKQSYELIKNMNKLSDTHVISWGGSQVYLPFFLLYALIKSFAFMIQNDVAVVHLGDALLSPLGRILKSFYKVPIVVTVHGLDITYPYKFYQLIVPKCLNKLDKVICVSHQTEKECIERGITIEKCVVIPNGINIDEFKMDITEDQRILIIREFEKKFGKRVDFENNKIILTVGRLVKRKGIHLFVSEIFPEILDEYENVLYFVIGEGPLKNKISNLVEKRNLQDHVFLWGKVNDALLKILYNISDIFVLPNIHVKGDMEGFGIVLLEACSAELCVVASNIEGIRDAIINGENGFLVDPNDTEKYRDIILKLLKNDKKLKQFGEKSRNFIRERYNWTVIAQMYYNEFEEAQKKR